MTGMAREIGEIGSRAVEALTLSTNLRQLFSEEVLHARGAVATMASSFSVPSSTQMAAWTCSEPRACAKPDVSGLGLGLGLGSGSAVRVRVRAGLGSVVRVGVRG